MSNSVPVQHPAVVLRSQYRNLRSLVAVLIVAVVGLSTAVVVISVDDQTVSGSVTSTHPATTQLGDPLQSRTQPTRQSGKPDESAVAAAISAKPTSVSAPDESKIAAAIASHSETGPIARERAYEQKISQMTPKQLRDAFGPR
jgi:hypothetical protein